MPEVMKLPLCCPLCGLQFTEAPGVRRWLDGRPARERFVDHGQLNHDLSPEEAGALLARASAVRLAPTG